MSSLSRLGESTVPTSYAHATGVPDGRIYDRSLCIPREGAIEVRFIRDGGAYAQGMTFHLKVDGCLIADLDPDESLRVWLNPGPHRMRIIMGFRKEFGIPRWLEIPERRTLDVELPSVGPCVIRLGYRGARPLIQVLKS
ncbi:MAG TPA: hypothetical protein VJ570_04450 [Holophagaceae bacterium]|nr:hypothetical protein [Holophagaceae bacterium]